MNPHQHFPATRSLAAAAAAALISSPSAEAQSALDSVMARKSVTIAIPTEGNVHDYADHPRPALEKYHPPAKPER